MIAGGGARFLIYYFVFSDTDYELANYGESSGAPSTEESVLNKGDDRTWVARAPS